MGYTERAEEPGGLHGVGPGHTGAVASSNEGIVRRFGDVAAIYTFRDGRVRMIEWHYDIDEARARFEQDR